MTNFSFQMLPPNSDKCPVCADLAHSPEIPHNRDSLFYQYSFFEQNGRWPTWADASASCPKDVRERLRHHLLSNEVSSQLIGDFHNEG